MYVIEICLRCPAWWAEVDLEVADSAELAIEDCVSRALLELLGPLVVDDVHIHRAPASDDHNGSSPGQVS